MLLRPRLWIPLLVLVFLGSALLRAPAATLWAWFAPAEAAVELRGLSGTLAQGQVGAVLVQGQPLLREIGWTLRPLELLRGRLGAQLSGGGEGSRVDGEVSVSLLGTLRLRAFRAQLPVKPWLAAAGQPYLPVEGQLALNLEALDLSGGLPQRTQGTLAVQGLRSTLARPPLVLGDFLAQLDTDDQGPLARLSTLQGPLELEGEARLQLAERRYQAELLLKPRAEAPPPLVNLLRGLGAADAQGRYRLQRQGALPAPAQADADAEADPEAEAEAPDEE